MICPNDVSSWSYTNGSQVSLTSTHFVGRSFSMLLQINFLQDCTLKVLCGTKDIPSITSNTFGNAKNIPLEDSIPSSVTINPEGLLYMYLHTFVKYLHVIL